MSMRSRKAFLLTATATVFIAAVSQGIVAAPQGSAITRLEHDLLGEKRIPDNVYYGVQTARALENFQISNMPMNYFPEFIDAYAIVKLAAARANTAAGAMKS